MGFSVALVEGAALAEEAGRLLDAAWDPPALRYSPEYLRWQLSFPDPLPAAAAYNGTVLVGFAGITARRLRSGAVEADSGIVSFVAVDPEWRKQGVAAELYRRLLGALKERALPVVTFAVAGSGGESVLQRAYAEAGFQMQPLGEYPVYGSVIRGDAPCSEWIAELTGDTAALPAILEACAADDRMLWSYPAAPQTAHYLRDARPRKLIVLRHRETGAQGAAWVIQSEFRTRQGLDTVTTIESLLLPRQYADALPVLFHAAAMAWNAGGIHPVVVNAPSLNGFEPALLRRAGIRMTGVRYHGYLFNPGPSVSFGNPQGTNLELI